MEQVASDSQQRPSGWLLDSLLQSRARLPEINEGNRYAVTRSAVDDLTIIRHLGDNNFNGWELEL